MKSQRDPLQDRDPLTRFCDLDDPDEIRQVEVLREVLWTADEIVATAKQNAERDIATAEGQAERMRKRVRIAAREIRRGQGRRQCPRWIAVDISLRCWW